jgi:hypothetical protein
MKPERPLPLDDHRDTGGTAMTSGYIAARTMAAGAL